MARKTTSGLPPYSESLAGVLLAAREAVMAPIRPHLRASNITEQQWRVLRVLSDAGVLDATRIADDALLYTPSVTRILKDLADRKLIERQSDPADARRSIISVTEAGRALVRNTAHYTKVLVDGYADAFGKDRLEAFMAEARALAAALERFQSET
jgi:homoprotocatechuate degradation regulator HpaR